MYSYMVEVRHPAFFQKGDEERTLNRLLMSLDVDRVCFDSRSLFAKDPRNELERDAKRKKHGCLCMLSQRGNMSS
ncbi:hypothetical protein [Endozoicomonas ascidiicola]|uniref:hypothetical protein n=1 Tax=Endozoicomonas ascidiicola TaxID=1698521 RepID=UPI0008310757|nr:hypothetical protein [Endozoicomonas ascidiicola]